MGGPTTRIPCMQLSHHNVLWLFYGGRCGEARETLSLTLSTSFSWSQLEARVEFHIYSLRLYPFNPLRCLRTSASLSTESFSSSTSHSVHLASGYDLMVHTWANALEVRFKPKRCWPNLGGLASASKCSMRGWVFVFTWRYIVHSDSS